MKNEVVSMNDVHPAAPAKPKKLDIVSTNTVHPAAVPRTEPGKRVGAADPIIMGEKPAAAITEPKSEAEEAPKPASKPNKRMKS